ncbi:MAG: sigma 54-interacting transcriptional regulator [Candidatus Cloacimonas sp.]|jgi:transcriptional regulator with PAS, ATPase and Fis domain|nr:sigma 54-interacting transcriptional regulator [Candidatus Cloacimonas sp.]
MHKELSIEITQSLDLQSELNPPQVLEHLQQISRDELSPAAINQLRYFEAKSLFTMQNYEEAEKIAVDCIQHAIAQRDFYSLVHCSVLQGLCYKNLNLPIRERPCLELALEYALQADNIELVVFASSFYLSYLHRISAHNAALEEEKRIVDLIPRIPPSHISINTLIKIASINMDLAKPDKAIKYLSQALQYAKTLEIPYFQLTIINNLASAYIGITNYQIAEELLQSGLEVAEQLCLNRQIVLMLFNLGNLMLAKAQYPQGIEYYDTCLAKISLFEFNPPQLLLDIYSNYSLCHWNMQDNPKALEYINKAIEIAKAMNQTDTVMLLELNRTNILASEGEFKAVKDILNRIIKYYKKTKQYPLLLIAYKSLAKLYKTQNDYQRGFETYEMVDKVTDTYIAQILSKQAEADTAKLNLPDIYFPAASPAPGSSNSKDLSYGFIGKSKAHTQVLNSALLAARHHNTNVLIMGESGTGKEVIAQIIHKNSIRRNFPLVSVNVSALTATLVESELFGHTKGAFTGANAKNKGYFLQADKGSIFLDEITEMPYELQSKLLRVIETRKVTAVGSSIESCYDSRIISATNKNIREQVTGNKFRLDLYHRLNTIEIFIPPLRNRTEDIEPLIRHFVDFFADALNKNKPFLDSSFLETMAIYSFPGNVRELKNIIERMYILSNGVHWDAKLLCQINPFNFGTTAVGATQSEEDIILKALIKAKGKQKDAAVLLNISEPTLHRRIVKYNLQCYTRKGN